MPKLNKHPFSDKLPAIEEDPLKSIISSYVTLGSVPESNQDFLVEAIFDAMGRFYGGIDKIYITPEDKDDLMLSYKIFLSGESIRSIISGLYQIIDGKTEYMDVPPKAPSQFLKICRNAPAMPPFESNIKLELVQYCSKEEAKANLKKIKELIAGLNASNLKAE